MPSASSSDWDGTTYDRISDPQLAWAGPVIERLQLRGDEVVLDAGCGSGRVTELLVAALPHGRVIAVDGSAKMLEVARERLGARVELIESNLLDLQLDHPVDAVFSNAVFHWIRDHRRLFSRLAGLLVRNGRLEAQCGGKGNVADFKAAAAEQIATRRWAPYFVDWEPAWRFAGPKRTEKRLLESGFADASCSLLAAPTPIADPVPHLKTVCANPYLERIPAAEADRFVAELRTRLPDPLILDHVRLNISARRR